MAEAMPVTLTALQYAVLVQLAPDDQRGRELREALVQWPMFQNVSRTAFYQLMARLESNGWVAGWYVPIVKKGVTFQERAYRITAEGRDAVINTAGFYLSGAEKAGLLPLLRQTRNDVDVDVNDLLDDESVLEPQDASFIVAGAC